MFYYKLNCIPKMEQTDKRKKSIGAAIGIVAFALSYFAAQQLFFCDRFSRQNDDASGV